MKNSGHHGFVLIIVLGLLGAMAMVAVMLVDTASESRLISQQGVHKAQARLLARSGYEAVCSGVRPALEADLDKSHHVDLPAFRGSAGVGNALGDQISSMIRDANSQINVNDGVRAGMMELGTGYDASAVDPFPPDGLGAVTMDLSAWINLRIRRLLNAYGDVHRFAGQLGWPEHDKSLFTSAAPYGQSLDMFTATAAGDRYTSQPGSTGLGDWVLAARPEGGYRRVEDLRETVNGWSSAHGGFSPGYTALAGSFFDLVREDLSVSSYEDDRFFRLTRELGPDNDGDGWADFQNDFSQSRAETMPVDRDPPDLRDLWRPHSVALINLNQCSDAVRAAVMYAPANVSYVAEGVDLFYDFYYGDLGLHPAYAAEHMQAQPTLGVAGPTFEAANMLENGQSTVLQKNRLMSLRDAMVLAQGYRAYGESDPEGWPQGFNQFRYLLGTLAETQCPMPERATKFTGPGYHSQMNLRMTVGQCHFTEFYLQYTLPNIFSCVRRLPGYLHAPAALLSPYVQEGGGETRGKGILWLSTQPEWPRPHHVLRSVEDFVFRAPLPKVCFTTRGTYSVRSLGGVTLDGVEVTSTLEAVVRLLTPRVWRTQSEFNAGLSYDTGEPTNNITIGPEAPSVVSSDWLGVIGPRDRDDGLSTSSTIRFESMFEENGLSPTASTNWQAADPASDPWISNMLTAGVNAKDNTTLSGSSMEDGSVSLFLDGSSGCDVSPFGGLSFSSRGHGIRASGVFTDSLYLRPTDMMPLSGNGLADEFTGEKFNKGVISMWVRVPSGYQFVADKRAVFSGTFWEQRVVSDDRVPYLPPMGLVTAMVPTYFSCYLKGEPRTGDRLANKGLWRVGFHIGRSPSGLITYTQGDTIDLTPRSDWAADLAAVPFDPDNVLPDHGSAFNLIGQSSGRHVNSQTQKMGAQWYWPDDYLGIGAWPHHQVFPNPIKANPQRSFTFRPGGWVKVICAFDLGDMSLGQYGTKANLLVQGGKNTTNSTGYPVEFIPPGMGRNQQAQQWDHHEVTGNPNMILAFGEFPTFLTTPMDSVDELYCTTAANAADFNSIARQGLRLRMMPFGRLDSAIDDIVVHFGDTGGLDLADMDTAFGGGSATPGFALRYSLSNTTWTAVKSDFLFNPGLTKAEEVFTIGLRTYDPPFEQHDSWNGNPGMHENVAGPRVRFMLVNGQTGNAKGHAAETLPAALGPNFPPGSKKIRVSRDHKLFDGTMFNSEDRIRIRFSRHKTWGGGIGEPNNTVVDAPWVEEIKMTTWLPEPTVARWSLD